ncbi:MAG TPA: hypothetical protein VGV64_07295 [Thermoplasmata archaeon]|nr:hypothetical protein [Thermoplasmata archaeon]
MRGRSVALATLDAALYEELAGALRERRIPTISLVPGQRIPESVAVVLTSPEECDGLNHPRVIPVPPQGERTALWAAVEHALHPGSAASELVVGIDPGPRPGYAILSEDRTLGEGTLDRPEAVAQLARLITHRFAARAIRFRVGSGDRLARDRIVNALSGARRPIELVNESGTTPRGLRRPRDAIAARAIARTAGRPVRGPTPLSITPGDIANLQRLSREGSGGRFTIPRSEAGRVLRGEITLPEALARGDRRYRRPGPAGEATGPRAEPP